MIEYTSGDREVNIIKFEPSDTLSDVAAVTNLTVYELIEVLEAYIELTKEYGLK